MRHHHQLRQLALLATILMLTFACQEETNLLDTQSDELDLATAEGLVQDYFNHLVAEDPSSASRVESMSYNPVVTILKYENGQLLYRTPSEGGGFMEVNEETVTANVGSGEFVFWYAGAGLSFLDGIEFDSLSSSVLNEAPTSYITPEFWLVGIPEDASGNILKYDILYTLDGDNEVIRLDPKIQVQ